MAELLQVIKGDEAEGYLNKNIFSGEFSKPVGGELWQTDQTGYVRVSCNQEDSDFCAGRISPIGTMPTLDNDKGGYCWVYGKISHRKMRTIVKCGKCPTKLFIVEKLKEEAKKMGSELVWD